MTPERWKRVDGLLQTLLPLPADEREAFLRRACGDDDSLVREVRSLLSAHEQAGSFLEHAAVERTVDPSLERQHTERLTRPEPLVGRMLSHYRVVGRLGGGGMGVVYKAEDTRLLRPVALKFLAAHYAAAPDALARFRREARAASALNHPNICTVYDVGEEDGHAFIAMELLQGMTLSARIAAEPPDMGTLLRVSIGVIEALDAAHAAGIIHRDIKPANLFVTSRGPVKVLDFGIAKIRPLAGQAALETTVTAAGDLTARGSAIGTLSYMSPEQVRGEQVDTRTDLFSFGVVLYEMATGTRPFRGETPGVILDGILNREPLPPSQLNPTLPAALDAVVLKCLAKTREARYQSASDVREALEGLERVSTAVAVPMSTRRMRVPALAGAAAVVTVATIAGIFYFPLTPTLTDKDTIVLADFDNRTGDPVFDGVLRQGLSIHLAQSPFLRLVPDDRVRRHLRLMQQPVDVALTRQLARDVCEREGAAAVVNGSIAPLGSQYVLGLRAEDCSTGESIHDEQAQALRKEDVLAVLSRMAGNFRTRVGESLASVQRHSKPLPEATTSSLEALKAYSTALYVDATSGAASIPHLRRAVELDPTFARAHALLGIAYSVAGESVLSRESTSRAYELRDRVTDQERFFITAMYDRQVTGNLERLQQTYEMWARTYPRDPDPLGLLAGFCAHGTGQYDLAIESARQSVALKPEHPVYAHLSVASASIALERLDDAEVAIGEGAELEGGEHPDFLLFRYFVALLRGDDRAMQRYLAQAKGRDGVDRMLHVDALAAVRAARMRDGRRLSTLAIDTAREAGRREVAGMFHAATAVWEALYGNKAAARQHSGDALQLSNGRDVQYPAAFALARIGDSARAQELAFELERRFPEDTSVRFTYLPVLRAQLALNAGDAATALRVLEPAWRFDLALPGVAFNGFFGAMYPAYLRGEAYLSSNQPREAAAEFGRIIRHRGIVLADPIDAMARLQRARALVRAGDAAAAKTGYEDLLTLWRAGDADVTLLSRARAESATLQHRGLGSDVADAK